MAADSREARGADRRTELPRPQNSPLDRLRSGKATGLHVLSFILPGVRSEESTVVSWEERSRTDGSL